MLTIRRKKSPPGLLWCGAVGTFPLITAGRQIAGGFLKEQVKIVTFFTKALMKDVKKWNSLEYF